MGGYGTLRLAMKRPDVFSSLYPMSACCMLERGEPGEAMAAAEALKTREAVAALRYPNKSTLARAAAWSPNPKNPPLFVDLPVKDGVPQPAIQAKWLANSTLAMIDQYTTSLSATRRFSSTSASKTTAWRERAARCAARAGRYRTHIRNLRRRSQQQGLRTDRDACAAVLLEEPGVQVAIARRPRSTPADHRGVRPRMLPADVHCTFTAASASLQS